MASQTNGNETSGKQRPAFSKRYFPVQLSVFEYRNGEDQRLNHSLKLSKSFRRTPESDWETSDYLAPEDALVAAQLLTEGYIWVQHRRNEDFRERRSQQDEVLQGATAGAEFPADIPF
jgi:hypothetical protein